MIVSYLHQFVFVSNPKAASTSIESALSGLQERVDLNAVQRPGFYTARHMPAVEIRERLGPSQWDNMFSFGVVRHPCDWLVSQLTYNYRRLNRAVPEDRKLTEDDVWHIHAILADFRGRPAGVSGSQWSFLCSESRVPIVTRVIALGRLRESWSGLMNRIGVAAPPLDKLNSTRHPAWTAWLDDGARKTVEVLWESDFELYRQAVTAPD